MVRVEDPRGLLGPALERAGIDVGADAPLLVVVDLTDPAASPDLDAVRAPGAPILGILGADVPSAVRLRLDDYLLAPYTEAQLATRVRFHLSVASRGGVLQLRDRTVDLGSGRVSTGAALTALELALLRYLVRLGGRTASRRDLEEAVWKLDRVAEGGRVYVGLRRLREKVEADPDRPQHLRTVRGEGYRFEAGGPTASVPSPAAATWTTPIGRFVDCPARRKVARALGAPGAVVLVGTVGVGKTRVAKELARTWPGHVVWVDAAGLPDADAVLGQLCQHLGVVPGGPAAVASGLTSARDPLVVVDGAEATAADPAALLDAIARSPGVRWLVTSRVRIPSVDPVESGPLGPAAARALLAARALEAGGDVDVDDPDLDALCDALGRIPLALELASPRLALVPPGAVLRGLDELLADDLLDRAVDLAATHVGPRDREALVALSVFARGFDLEAATAVVDDAQDALHGLVRASLVDRTRRPEGIHLALYEPVRAWARRRLEARPDGGAAVTDRLQHYVEALAERVVAEAEGPTTRTRERVALLQQDLLAAMARLRASAPGSSARVVLSLVRGTRDVYRPGSAVRQLLDAAVVAHRELPDAEAAALLTARARALAFSGAWDAAERMLAEARTRAVGLAAVPVAMAAGIVADQRGQATEALARYERALALARTHALAAAETEAERCCVHVLRTLGRLDEAIARLDPVLRTADEAGDAWPAAGMRDTLGELLADQGRAVEARELFRAALDGVLEGSGPGREASGEAFVLAHLGMLDRDAGRWGEAEEHLGGAAALLHDPWNRRWQSRVQTARAWVFAATGRPRAAHDEATAATAFVPSRPEVEPWVALAAACAGRRRLADTAAAAARARALAAGSEDPRDTDRVALADGIVAVARGDRAAAEAGTAPLARSLSPLVRAAVGWIAEGRL